MNYETILFEVSDGVAQVTLNRPDALNALNGQMCRDLMQVAIDCDENPAVRAVVLSGNGDNFCGGGDLKEFASVGDELPRHIKEMIVYLHAAVSRFARMNAPIVAAVRGSAAGAGMALACMCDLVVVDESTRFTMAYTRVGLTPDGSSTYFLPRIVGLKRALELALTNRTLSAHEAVDWGIATQVVPDGGALARAKELAAQLAAGPPLAFGGAKRLLHASLDQTLESQMELEAQSIANMARATDGMEGITAFLEKRQPDFKGK